MPAYIVNAGDLRTRITFQVPTESQDAGAAQTVTFADVATTPSVWSHWVYDHGQETDQSDSRRSSLRATVTVRHRKDVLTTWRVIMDGEPWSIIAPPEPVQNQNRWLVLRVERVKGSL